MNAEQGRRHERIGVGPDAIEGDVPEAEQACPTRHHVKTGHQNDRNADGGANADEIGTVDQIRNHEYQRDAQRRYDHWRDAINGQRCLQILHAHRYEAADHSGLLYRPDRQDLAHAQRQAENSARSKKQHAREQDEGGNILVSRRYQTRRKALGNAEHKSAQKRPTDAPNTADHGGCETLQSHEETEGEIDLGIEQPEQHAADTGHRGSDHIDQRNDPVDIDAHEGGCLHVLRGGTHHPPHRVLLMK